MTDLTAKLEAATEGSRELDAEIEISRRRFLGLMAAAAPAIVLPSGWICGPAVGDLPIEAPHYTTSLDAAMTLVSEGNEVEIRRFQDNGGYAFIFTENDSFSASAATPALALCSAALKAIALEE